MDETERRLIVDAQTLTAEGGFGYWFDDDPMGNINTTHHTMSRPSEKVIIINHPIEQQFAPAVWEYLHSNIISIAHTYRFNHDSCWNIHAGVAAAAFSDAHTDTGCIGLFATRAPHRLLHFIPTPGDTTPSAEVLISRPAELWVLERWAEPESRLLYYWPVMKMI